MLGKFNNFFGNRAQKILKLFIVVRSCVSNDDDDQWLLTGCVFMNIQELVRVGKALSLPEYKLHFTKKRNREQCTRGREAGNWEKACNYFNEQVKDIHFKGQRYWGAGDVDRGGEGNPWVEKEWLREKRE